MMTYRRKLNVILFSCAAITAILITFFVNQTIHYQVDRYMEENQQKRNDRLVTYFEDSYRKNQGFNEESGIELMHEAYMNQYCLILMDVDKKMIWGMNPDSLSSTDAIMEGGTGIYTADVYELEVDGKLVGYLEIGQHGSLLLSQADIKFKESINSSIALSTAIAFLSLIGLSLLFSKPLSKQMTEVAKMSRQLAKGEFDYRIKSRPKVKEFEVIEEGMNSLAMQLKSQQWMRKQLVSDVSHELRTPLNILQTNLEAMIDGIIPVTEERLHSLNQEVIRFGKLLSNLDLLKQFDATQIKLELKPISMSALVRQMELDLRALCLTKELSLTIHNELKTKDEVLGDEDQLKQVILNLISNACKFTDVGGIIQILVKSDEEQVILQVKDNGVGIDKEALPYVFDRFYRSDRSRNQTEGSGIGLSIVAEIIRLHGAQIELQSAEGKGTTVLVSFRK